MLVVEDHDLVRDALVRLLDHDPGIEVVAEANSVATGWAEALATRPDVALLDARLPDGTGVDLCRQVRAALPNTRCVILTGLDDPLTLAAAFEAGATAFVSKRVSSRLMIDAVRRAASAASHTEQQARAEAITVGAASPVLDPPPDPRFADLTAREMQILGLLAEGSSNRQIGHRLGIAERTANNNVSALLTKLHLNRTQAAVFAAALLNDHIISPDLPLPRLPEGAHIPASG